MLTWNTNSQNLLSRKAVSGIENCCEKTVVANLTKKLATIQSAFEAYKLQLKEEIDAQFEKCLAERRQYYERQLKKETDILRERHFIAHM
jgi:hypothetical protein